MFERFTEDARQVVVLAQDEARALRHNYIGTEHLLLGVLRQRNIASDALESVGVTLDRVRAEVVSVVGHGDEHAVGQIPFTSRGKRVLELSLREAVALGHKYIGPEHILLGLVRESQGVGARVLLDLGADPGRVRDSVVGLLARGQGVTHETGGRAEAGDPRVAAELEAITRAKEAAIEAQQFERAAKLREREQRLRQRLRIGDEHITVEIGSSGPLWSRGLFVTPFFGWLLFTVALGIGILVGWLIWG